MSKHSDNLQTPSEPPSDHLSERERSVVRSVWTTMRDWFERSLEELQERQRDEAKAKHRELKSEIEALIHDERFWERELEGRLRKLEAFELEFGSTRTAEESSELFREVRSQLAKRDNHWARILGEL